MVRNGTSQVLSVSALNQLIRVHLEEVFPDVWVEGEISNLRIPSSGHIYLTLKDEASQMRAVIFRFTNRGLKFTPRDGMRVLCRGRVSVYEPRGEYQLIIEIMEPRGVGALQLAFEQLKERLNKEGLFDPNRKRPLPVVPKRIGIVTSPTGAAIRDILKVLRRRFANIGILLNPVPVQGEGAAVAIADAIRELSAISDLDVLIVGRGGGSLEDLWAFNEEVVARAIFSSKIPVISAVGHEIDFTLSDMVADLRAPTPSAAAEMVVQSKGELIRRITSVTDRLAAVVRGRLRWVRLELDRQTAAMKDPRAILQTLFFRVDELDSRIKNGVVLTLRNHRKHMKHLQDVLNYQSPVARLRRLSLSVEHMLMRLNQAVTGTFKRDRSRLEACLGQLHSLSPLAVLSRGYSLTYRLPEMKLLRDAEEIKRGNQVQVRLSGGVLKCEVYDVKKDAVNPTQV